VVRNSQSGLPKLLTIKEAASRLQVCRATVYQLCSEGRIPHIRVSNSIRIPDEGLRKFLRTAAHRAAASPPAPKPPPEA
jgi:excisionase family DNA binding protein